MNRLAIHLAAIAALAIFTTHCASTTGMERAQKTSSSMEAVQVDIDETLDNIDAVETTLSELIREDRRDLQAAYELHSQNLESLEETSNKLIEDFREMESSAETYFTEWGQESENYENPRLQSVSEERRREIQEKYESINFDSSQLENRLKSYISENKEINTFLSNDLTPEGINAVAPLVEEVRDEGESLKREISQIQESVREVKTEMDQNRNTPRSNDSSF